MLVNVRDNGKRLPSWRQRAWFLFTIGATVYSSNAVAQNAKPTRPAKINDSKSSIPVTTNGKTCKSLQLDFDLNEYMMAVLHDLNAHAVVIEQNYNRNTYGSPSAETRRLAGARLTLKMDDDERLVKSDRITSLMVANKCTPPDHVASWFTYSEKNPDRKPMP